MLQDRISNSDRSNPLQLSVKNVLRFKHEQRIAGIDFVVEKISPVFGKQSLVRFTDYHLKGNKSIDMRLRLTPITTFLFCNYHAHLLYTYRETTDYREDLLGGEFVSRYDDEGNELLDVKRYWRVGDKTDPIQCYDSTGKPFVYWDYNRLTENDSNEEITEFVFVEHVGQQFMFLRGGSISLRDGFLIQ